MALSDEGREAIQESNRTRWMKCAKCGALATVWVDGAKIGGLAGFEYRWCPGCGWSTSKQSKQAKEQSLRHNSSSLVQSKEPGSRRHVAPGKKRNGTI